VIHSRSYQINRESMIGSWNA